LNMKKYPINKDFKLLCSYRPLLNFFVAWLARTFWWLVPKGKKISGVRQGKFIFNNPDDGRKVKVVTFEKAFSQKSTDEVDKKTSALIYFHGGAFVFGPIWSHYNNARRCVRETGCKVFLVKYRLAPKYAYPIGVRDCEEAYRYILNNASQLGVTEQRVALGGDSAGGFMAMSVARYAMRSDLPLPQLLMLLYPVVSPDDNYPSMRDFVDTPVWNSRANAKMWKMFLQGKKPDCDWENSYFEKIPTIYVETAQFDCLSDPAKDFAERVMQKGGNVILNQTDGTVHGYDVMEKSQLTEISQKERIRLLLGV